MEITCKACSSQHYVKNGKVRGKHCYKCKACDNNFIVGGEREQGSPKGKALAALLYGSGQSSYRFIANLFNVTRPAVQKWIRKIASRLPEPHPDHDIQEFQIDEMRHFIDQKTKNMDMASPGLCYGCTSKFQCKLKDVRGVLCPPTGGLSSEY